MVKQHIGVVRKSYDTHRDPGLEVVDLVGGAAAGGRKRCFVTRRVQQPNAPTEVLCNLAEPALFGITFACFTGFACYAIPFAFKIYRSVTAERSIDRSDGRLARSVNIHPTHLCCAFRQHYHCTPGDFVRRLRVDRARQYLAEIDTPLGRNRPPGRVQRPESFHDRVQAPGWPHPIPIPQDEPRSLIARKSLSSGKTPRATLA